METIDALKARTHLAALLDRVAKGETIKPVMDVVNICSSHQD